MKISGISNLSKIEVIGWIIFCTIVGLLFGTYIGNDRATITCEQEMQSIQEQESKCDATVNEIIKRYYDKYGCLPGE